MKDWSIANLTNSNFSEKRIWDLVKKSVDSVSMFVSILLGKPHSTLIQQCSPFTITNTTKIKVFSIVNCEKSDVPFISFINTEYKSRFSSYAKLFDIDTFLVMTKEKAIQKFQWIE